MKSRIWPRAHRMHAVADIRNPLKRAGVAQHASARFAVSDADFNRWPGSRRWRMRRWNKGWGVAVVLLVALTACGAGGPPAQAPGNTPAVVERTVAPSTVAPT